MQRAATAAQHRARWAAGAPCGMTSMSSSGGDAGEWSSMWLPRLTTCGGAGVGVGWGGPCRRGVLGRTATPLPRTEPVAGSQTETRNGRKEPFPSSALPRGAHVRLARQLVLHRRPRLFRHNDLAAVRGLAAGMTGAGRGGGDAQQGSTHSQQAHAAPPARLGGAGTLPPASPQRPPRPTAAPELLHALHRGAQIVCGHVVRGRLLARHRHRRKLARLVQGHGHTGAFEGGLAVRRQLCGGRGGEGGGWGDAAGREGLELPARALVPARAAHTVQGVLHSTSGTPPRGGTHTRVAPSAPVGPQYSAQSAGHWLYMSRACAEWQKRTASTADPKASR